MSTMDTIDNWTKFERGENKIVELCSLNLSSFLVFWWWSCRNFVTDQLILFFKMFFVEKLFFDWFVFF